MDKPAHATTYQWPSIEDEHWHKELKRLDEMHRQGHEFFLREFCTVTTSDTVGAGEDDKE
ncbi:hypothetical protein PEC106568_07080 [Pectobacterium carotovorum subsp. carotovorum]|nr:hypothetical protein PEC106568_07080 [Pectobacterium carotovorum subsp. carotovorum]